MGQFEGQGGKVRNREREKEWKEKSEQKRTREEDQGEEKRERVVEEEKIGKEKGEREKTKNKKARVARGGRRRAVDRASASMGFDAVGDAAAEEEAGTPMAGTR